MQDRPCLIEASEALRRRDELRFVDATWFLDPDRSGRAVHDAAHIPGAVHFGIDEVCARDGGLPHMLPTADRFAEWAGSQGLRPSDEVVVYDAQGLFSSPRAWWTLRAFGVRGAKVLNGGLPAWRASGGAVTPEPPVFGSTEFEARLREDLVIGRPELEGLIEKGKAVILDARPAGRFLGRDPEPRPGLRSGHMPGAINLPQGDVVRAGRLLHEDLLKRLFDERGLRHEDMLVTTCGSGVTAATLALALECAGFPAPRLYDGSWAEWGADPRLPVVRD